MHIITPEQVEEELRISNDRFIAELEIRPNLFAIPWRVQPDSHRGCQKASFVAAFGQNSESE